MWGDRVKFLAKMRFLNGTEENYKLEAEIETGQGEMKVKEKIRVSSQNLCL